MGHRYPHLTTAQSMSTTTPPILSQLALGYSPIIDRQRGVLGYRLTVCPSLPDAALDPLALLGELATVWPALETPPGNVALAPGTVALNVVGEAFLRAMVDAQPAAPFAVEVPAFMLAEADFAAAVQRAHAAGVVLWIKGSAPGDLPADLQSCFRVAMFESGAAAPTVRGARWATVAAQVRTLAEIDSAAKLGAIAVTGWPLEDPVLAAVGRTKVAADLQVIVELINRVDREEPLDRLEATLKGDPTLAFRLMRYLNSAAFGLRVEISSFRHALMMLGYQKLKRWLALLLASASKDVNVKPVMFAAVRRGLIMEELARSSGDAELRGEMFICGVFSLLDRLLKQPFDELLRSVPVPERVLQALGSREGSFVPYLDLVRAIELGSSYEVAELAEQLMLAPSEINRALLAALKAAGELD